MRVLIASIAVLITAGCASQPGTDSKGAAAASTAPAGSPTAGAPAAANMPATGASAQAGAPKTFPGYKAKQKDGQTVYCKKVAKVGSRFEDEYCATGDQLESVEARAQEDRESFRRNSTLCGTGGCGGT